MVRRLGASLLSICVLTLVVGCTNEPPDTIASTSSPSSQTTVATTSTAPTQPPPTTDNVVLRAILVDPSRKTLGTETFSEVNGALQVAVQVEGLPPGFHGLHVHSVGLCEPDSRSPDGSQTGHFLSAGGHLGAGTSRHGAHSGDLPALYVTAAGTGSLTVLVGSVTAADLADADGSAIMVHAMPDNLAYIPNRYSVAQTPGPDEATQNTGDGGARIACGRIDESAS
jgi:Cu-Zn family superoxide dismutase